MLCSFVTLKWNRVWMVLLSPAVVFVLRALTSWTAVYIAILGPAVMLLANFVFGNCTVAAWLEQSHGMASREHRNDKQSFWTSNRIGRATVAAGLISALWQRHVFFYYYKPYRRATLGVRHDCDVLWDTLSYMSNALRREGQPASSFASYLFADESCTVVDLVYHLSLLSFVVAFLLSAIISPQEKVAEEERSSKASTKLPQQTGERNESRSSHFCSRCGTRVNGMDHHCYFVHNCIGTANRMYFIVLLISVTVLSSCLVSECTEWVVRRVFVGAMLQYDSKAPCVSFVAASQICVGYIVLLVVLVGVGILLPWHLLLVTCGYTQVGLLKSLKYRYPATAARHRVSWGRWMLRATKLMIMEKSRLSVIAKI